MTRRKKTDFIIVHCSATPPSADIGMAQIRKWHTDKGWRDIGYHAVIRLDGTVEFGRHPDDIGAHCKGFNGISYGICLVGGLDEDGNPKDTFSLAQRIALRWMITAAKAAYPDVAICGHRDMYGDTNEDGVINEQDRLKECPCFDVKPEFGP